MNIEEYSKDISWRLAEMLLEEIRETHSTRPKQFTYFRKAGDPFQRADAMDVGVGEYTFFFFGCPFRLKDKKMLDYLRTWLLISPPYQYEFSKEDRLNLFIEALNAQINDGFWLVDVDIVPDRIVELCDELGEFEKGIDLINSWQEIVRGIFTDETQKEKERAIAWLSYLNGKLGILYLALKGGLDPKVITDYLISCTEILVNRIEEAEAEAKEEDSSIDLNIDLEYDFFDKLIKLIPLIETCENPILNYLVYEFAATYYEVTNRMELNEKYAAKVRAVEEEAHKMIVEWKNS